MVGARYIEWVAAGARFDIQVAKWLPSPRLDLDGLGRLTSVCIAGWPQTKREGLAARHILR
jgi:hypothetical protein